MSTSSNSDHGDGGGSDDESNVTMFHCKLCPGVTFTAAERESHRRVHLEKLLERRPGPKSRKVRVPAPPGTNSTLFTIEPRGAAPINSSSDETDEEEPPSKKSKQGKTRPGGGKKKIRSKKNFREDIDKNVRFNGA